MLGEFVLIQFRNILAIKGCFRRQIQAARKKQRLHFFSISSFLQINPISETQMAWSQATQNLSCSDMKVPTHYSSRNLQPRASKAWKAMKQLQMMNDCSLAFLICWIDWIRDQFNKFKYSVETSSSSPYLMLLVCLDRYAAAFPCSIAIIHRQSSNLFNSSNPSLQYSRASSSDPIIRQQSPIIFEHLPFFFFFRVLCSGFSSFLLNTMYSFSQFWSFLISSPIESTMFFTILFISISRKLTRSCYRTSGMKMKDLSTEMLQQVPLSALRRKMAVSYLLSSLSCFLNLARFSFILFTSSSWESLIPITN